MAPYKRPMLVFEGKPYRKGILSSEEPKYSRSGPLDGILLNDLSLGFIVRLELFDGPVVRVWRSSYGRFALIRCGGAVAVTIVTPLPGFRGFRYRFWDRAEEVPFPDWRMP